MSEQSHVPEAKKTVDIWFTQGVSASPSTFISIHFISANSSLIWLVPFKVLTYHSVILTGRFLASPLIRVPRSGAVFFVEHSCSLLSIIPTTLAQGYPGGVILLYLQH